MSSRSALNKLNELTVRNAKTSDKLVKLSDGGGLQLWLMPTGSKLWRLAYRYAGKQKLLAMGQYPYIGLADARERRNEARKIISEGGDPSALKLAARRALTNPENTFQEIADEYLAKLKREGRAESTLKKLEWLLGLAASDLGWRPVEEIKPADVLVPLRRVEARGRYETARRMRSTLSAVFRYAVATARAETDPAAPLQGALTIAKVKHRAAITDPVAFGGLLRAIEGFQGEPTTVAGLQLMAVLFPRPGELRQAEWTEFDLDTATWTIPAERAKMRRPQRKPLPTQAIDILQRLGELTGDGPLVFPSLRSRLRPISNNTMNAALRRLGYSQDEATAHGFRATASTLLNESGKWSADAIERELGHVEGNSVRRAYARGEYWDERVSMIQWWADHCDVLRSGGEVVPFSRAD